MFFLIFGSSVSAYFIMSHETLLIIMGEIVRALLLSNLFHLKISDLVILLYANFAGALIKEYIFVLHGFFTRKSLT